MQFNILKDLKEHIILNFNTMLHLSIKKVWYQHTYRERNEWNRKESPKINAHIQVKLIFNKGTKVTQWRNNKLFNKWNTGSRSSSKRFEEIFGMMDVFIILIVVMVSWMNPYQNVCTPTL